jgi:hypothetical protein
MCARLFECVSVQMDKVPPTEVADALIAALNEGTEDVIPDPTSKQLYAAWQTWPHKQSPVRRRRCLAWRSASLHAVSYVVKEFFYEMYLQCSAIQYGVSLRVSTEVTI